MMEQNTKYKLSPVLLWGGVVLVLLWLILSLWSFSTRAFSYAKQTSEEQLKEVASQTVSAVRIKMADSVDSIVTLAAVFSAEPELHSFSTLTKLKNITETCYFNRIRITTLDGKSYAAPGNMIDISDRDYFKAAIAGNSGVSNIMDSLYNDSVVFVAYAPIYRNGEIVGTIHGACELQTLADVLNVESFNGQGYAHIFQPDGGMVLKSTAEDVAQVNFKNIWEFLEDAEFAEDYSLEVLRQDVQKGQSGITSYRRDGVDRISYYTPTGLNDWYVMQVLPINHIVASTKAFEELALLLIIKTLVLFILLAIGIVCFGNQSRKAILAANREMRISNERFRIANSHNPSMVFDYNAVGGYVSFEGDTPPTSGFPQELSRGLGHIYTNNILVPESVAPLRQIFEKIHKKEASASAIVKIQNTAAPMWYRIILTNVFDEKGTPVRTIGTLEDVTEGMLSEQRRVQDEQYRRAILTDALLVYDINVTQDTYTKFDPAIPKLDTEQDESYHYSADMTATYNTVVYHEDREHCMESADRSQLVQAFEQGILDLYCEYRQMENDDVKWVSSTTHLFKDIETGELHAFAYIRDIHERKIKELELRERAERDPLTGLYNRKAAEDLISAALSEATPRSVHGVLSIDLDWFKEVNDSYGHQEGDALLRMVSREFESMVRSNDVVSRMGGDEFMIFLRDARSLSQIETIAARLCDHVRRMQIGVENPVTVSIGVAIVPQHGITYDALYKTSDIALYYAKQNGKNRYAVYFPSMVLDNTAKIS